MTKIKKIEFHFTEILKELGLDINRDGIKDSPARIAKSWVNELFSGLDEENFPNCKTFENDFNFNQPLIYKDITVNSMCEHHFLPFFGSVNIVYIPKKKIIGLSKFNRIVDFYSKKPQLQERLTVEIFEKLSQILETEDIIVSLKCLHMCVKMRGINHDNSFLITNKVGGVFLEKENIPSNSLHI